MWDGKVRGEGSDRVIFRAVSAKEPTDVCFVSWTYMGDFTYNFCKYWELEVKLE